MKIVLVHNRYAMPGRGSGEEVMVAAIQELLQARGHEVLPYIRSSLELQHMIWGQARAFLSGIYSVSAKRHFARFLGGAKPDLIIVQNLFPLLSPSVLLACRQFNVPVIMRCPNYRLICPNGRMMTAGQICEKCSGGREYWGLLRNCEQDIFKSAGYVLRNVVARQFALFKNNVDIFMVLTSFAKQKFIENGFDPRRVHILSALADPQTFEPSWPGNMGSYVGLVGRVSPEKGVDTFIAAARLLPHVVFKIAGPYRGEDPLVQNAPENVAFLGQLNQQALKQFYQDARIIVVPSRWYEGLPVVMLEAMLSAKPVICSRIGGLPDVVDDEVTGLLFEPNDERDLRQKIERLWNHPDTCRQFGMAGRCKAETAYTPNVFYERLMEAYDKSLAFRMHA